MNKLMIVTGSALVCLLLAGCGESPNGGADAMPPPEEAAAGTSAVGTLLDEAVAGEHRSDDNRARDEWRNPKETLTFFGLRPDMTVVELYPGTGWYTEILAPVLRDDGQLVAAQFDPDIPPDYRASTYSAYMDMIHSNPEVYGEVEVILLGAADTFSLGPDGSADMVVTFRNLHGLINNDEFDAMLAAMARVLRPGGVLGVVQHRSEEGVDPIERARTGYVPESFVIERARAAGFELDARAEINANPADTKDYSIGVWALPPSLRGDLDNRDEREAIGESDRMTLRFVKRS